MGSTLKCCALQVCSSYNTVSMSTFVFAITDEIKDMKVFNNILFPRRYYHCIEIYYYMM